MPLTEVVSSGVGFGRTSRARQQNAPRCSVWSLWASPPGKWRKTLGISPKTADHHIHHVDTKIGVSTRGAAALYAIEHGVLTDLQPMR